MHIIPIHLDSPYLNQLIQLTYELWPEHTIDELASEIPALMQKQYTFYGVLEQNFLIAFMQLSIRHDYVNGTSSSPIGYLEGIYVKESYRRKKVASQLIAYATKQFLDCGITEFASDTSIDNEASQAFHTSVGFTETERCVYFSKKIKPDQ